VGAPNFEVNLLPRVGKIYLLRAAVLMIVVIATFGSGPVWAEEDEYAHAGHSRPARCSN
jgi:hypothetical protein